MNMQRLVKFVSEFSAEAYKAEPSAGYIDDTDAVMPGEPTASGGLLSSEMFAEFSLPYLQTEIKAIKSTGMSASLHICGDTTNHLPFMAQSGAKILATEQKVNPYFGMKQVDGKVVLVGDVVASATVDVEDHRTGGREHPPLHRRRFPGHPVSESP